LGAEFEEDVEEADGIGASGDRDSDMVAGGQHLVAGDGCADLCKEGHFDISAEGWLREGTRSLALRLAATTSSGKGRVAKRESVARPRLITLVLLFTSR
jgi:hypothetical protein